MAMATANRENPIEDAKVGPVTAKTAVRAGGWLLDRI